MNLKKRLKKFFTLNRSADDGFTLVELIVVIAILGILAGVGTVAYSGYIKKAQTAADEILLDSLNTAFAAACIENGVDVSTLADGSVTATMSNGEVTAVSQYDTEFDKYYEGGKFKVYTALEFVDGMFKGNGEVLYVEYKGNRLPVTKETLELLQNSTYSDVGAENLLNEIASLTEMVEGTGFDAMELMQDVNYLRSFASYMGVAVTDDMDSDAIVAAINDAGITMSPTMAVNGLVYWAADNSSEMTVSGVTDFLTNGNFYNNFDEDDGKKLAQAAMVYGMYTAYVEYADIENPESDPITIAKTVGEDAEFVEYVQSAQGQKDLEAYIAAMGVINDSTSNSDVTIDVLNNGFNNTDLINLLDQYLRK